MDVNDSGFAFIFCTNPLCCHNTKGLKQKVSFSRKFYNSPFIRDGDNIFALCEKCMQKIVKDVQDSIKIYRKPLFEHCKQLELDLFSIPIDFKNKNPVDLGNLSFRTNKKKTLTRRYDMSAPSYDCGKDCSVTVLKRNPFIYTGDFKNTFDTILVPTSVNLRPTTMVAQKVHELCGDEIQKELQTIARNRYPGSVFVTGSGKQKDIFNSVMHMVIDGVPETYDPIDVLGKGLQNCFRIAHYTNPNVSTIGIPTFYTKELSLGAFVLTTINVFSHFVSMMKSPNLKNVVFIPKNTKEFGFIIEHF